MGIKLLDCSLRDGGYYNNWDFSEEFIDNYLKNISKLPFDYVEIGYISNDQNGYYGQLRYVDEELISKCKQLNLKVAVMIDIKSFDDNLLAKINSVVNDIDLFRFAINYEIYDQALRIIEKMNLPFNKIALNIMYLSKWIEDKSFLKKIASIQNINYLYLVDSYGSILPGEISKALNFIQKENPKLNVGFHPHNNLELAFANSLEAIKNGIKIIDSTFYGMGRGAGNLKSELILTYLNQKENIDIDFESLGYLNENFIKLHDKYKWGVDYPYILSGFLNYPQKDIMFYQKQRFLSLESLVEIVKGDKREIGFSHKFDPITITNKERYVLIGGGDSIKIHKNKILKWATKNNDITILFVSSKFSHLFQKIYNKKIFCLHGKEAKRVIYNNENLFLVSPTSNSYETELIDNQRTYTYNSSNQIFENSMLELALLTLIKNKISKVFCLGFDGYSDSNQIKHFKDLYIENQEIFSKYQNQIEITSLTSSLYKDIKKSTIYGQ